MTPKENEKAREKDCETTGDGEKSGENQESNNNNHLPQSKCISRVLCCLFVCRICFGFSHTDTPTHT